MGFFILFSRLPVIMSHLSKVYYVRLAIGKEPSVETL